MMPDVPFMRMWWGDFFADPKVAAFPGETRGIYACLLGAMWQNGGWLPNDDSIIARLLGLHVLTWKLRHKPLILPLLLHRDVGMVLGGVLTQKRLEIEWQNAARLIEETKANAARARAGKAAKSTKGRSAPEPEKASAPDTAAASVTEPVTDVSASSELIAQKIEQGAALTAERPVLSRTAVDAGSLRHRANGMAEGSADVGSPGLVGRSPPQPSETIRPSPALLATPLVKKARSGLMAALDDDED